MAPGSAAATRGDDNPRNGAPARPGGPVAASPTRAGAVAASPTRAARVSSPMRADHAGSRVTSPTGKALRPPRTAARTAAQRVVRPGRLTGGRKRPTRLNSQLNRMVPCSDGIDLAMRYIPDPAAAPGHSVAWRARAAAARMPCTAGPAPLMITWQPDARNLSHDSGRSGDRVSVRTTGPVNPMRQTRMLGRRFAAAFND